MIRIIFIFPLVLSFNLHAEELVAVVNLKFIKDTNKTASEMCYIDGEQTDCHRWSTYYLFEARVKKVLSGKLSSKKIKVIYGRHALLEKDFRNVPVTLEKTLEYDGAQYKIKEWGTYREMYCFSGKYNQPSNVSYVKKGEHMKCYEEER